MDFYRIVKAEPDKRGVVEVFPDYAPRGFTDLMIRGGAFYAIWDEQANTWSTDEYDVVRLVDEDLRQFIEKQPAPESGRYNIKWMNSFKSGSLLTFNQFVRAVSDRYTPLDRKLVFQGDVTGKNDYVTKSLPYKLEGTPTPAWDELTSVLYSPVNRQKIEWAIGSIVAGDSRNIQKFLVFYGSGGTGKSTIMNIIEKLFVGYFAPFEAKALGSNNGAFSTAAFKHNPLVAIQHDGDLSMIQDNTKLNSIVAHEDILINEKFQTAYSMRIDSFLFMGTNKPVRITDSRSGLVRRLIDVHPTGDLIAPDVYQNLMHQVDFELGGIAQKCLDVYLGLGKSYYNGYRPTEMMAQTDYFYNFVAASYDLFLQQGGVSNAQAWGMFKEFCEEQKVDAKMPQFKFREELKNYFESFEQRVKIDDQWVWGWYSGFKTKTFVEHELVTKSAETLEMVKDTSLLDEVLQELPAQYGRADKHGNEVPEKRWDNVTTKLKNIDTKQLHYVKPPENHIVIDFDLKDAAGEKSLELNLKAAAKWPKTYGELSKGGNGVHLHYMYDGDVTLLKSVYEEDVEVKVFTGGSSLRRRLSRCNNTPIATLNGGLPLKEKKVLEPNIIQNEKHLRALIVKALRRETDHSATKPNIDFIKHVLDEAYEAKIPYDVSNMQASIISFALSSTHQSDKCLEMVALMKFASEVAPGEGEDTGAPEPGERDQRLVFFDTECYPNLFLIRWKYEGENEPIISMWNPKPEAVYQLFKMKLVGYNCRDYDNHMIYAASLGWNQQALYELSQSLIRGDRNAYFAAAYELSYVDVLDYMSADGKMTLKKWQVKLGIHHQEMDIPWDQPVPEDRMKDVEEYCGNDVVSLEAVHNHRQGDYRARLILAALSGLTPNRKTNAHSAQIVFGNNKRPQPKFKYTHLDTVFPGYVYERGVSTYRGEVAGEGGFVWAKPGVHDNVALLDVASMHPTSIIEMNMFGDEYTAKFKKLLDIRLALKQKKFEKVLELDPELEPYITIPHEGYDLSGAKALSDALKTVINSVYGLTAARHDNRFRDPRNKDNIVAKRGALFMIELKHHCIERGMDVVHIKTDSIKIANATTEDIEFVTEFGKQYGYDFEHEATYQKFVLINDAVYIARKDGEWSATGKDYKDPYVYKSFFTDENLEWEDHFEARSILKGSMCLDFDLERKLEKDEPFVMDDNCRFIGRTGVFVPVREGCGGGHLYRVFEDKGIQKTAAIPGTKGFLWKEIAQANMDEIDQTFYEKKLASARKKLEEYGPTLEEILA